MSTNILEALNVVIVVYTDHERKSRHKTLIDLDDWADCSNKDYEENIHRILGHTNYTLEAIHQPMGVYIPLHKPFTKFNPYTDIEDVSPYDGDD